MLCKILFPSSSSASIPSLLVKMMGIYTIKSRKFDTSLDQVRTAVKWAEMDYIIMEHLFRERTITQKFDLKGIKSRVVDGNNKLSRGIPLIRLFTDISMTGQDSAINDQESTSRCRTLWDGNWLENVYRQSAKTGSAQPSEALLATLFDNNAGKQNSSTLCIHPHSKFLLRDAMKRDTDFLAKCNVIDYSLLVGVDEERQELVVGIVDYIGEYTFWKRLENKGKTTLMYLEKRFKDAVKMNSIDETSDSKAQNVGHAATPMSPKMQREDPVQRTSWSSASSQVTVQPPDTYKWRFTKAMDEYFLSIPDKWHVDNSMNLAQ